LPLLGNKLEKLDKLEVAVGSFEQMASLLYAEITDVKMPRKISWVDRWYGY
jgi:hypothetical protein